MKYKMKQMKMPENGGFWFAFSSFLWMPQPGVFPGRLGTVKE
jgi:hypothetical protein